MVHGAKSIRLSRMRLVPLCSTRSKISRYVLLDTVLWCGRGLAHCCVVGDGSEVQDQLGDCWVWQGRRKGLGRLVVPLGRGTPVTFVCGEYTPRRIKCRPCVFRLLFMISAFILGLFQTLASIFAPSIRLKRCMCVLRQETRERLLYTRWLTFVSICL